MCKFLFLVIFLWLGQVAFGMEEKGPKIRRSGSDSSVVAVRPGSPAMGVGHSRRETGSSAFTDFIGSPTGPQIRLDVPDLPVGSLKDQVGAILGVRHRRSAIGRESAGDAVVQALLKIAETFDNHNRLTEERETQRIRLVQEDVEKGKHKERRNCCIMICDTAIALGGVIIAGFALQKEKTN